jgi:hypothetical protein
VRARIAGLLAAIERLGAGRSGIARLLAVLILLLGSVAAQGLQVDDFWHRAFFLGHPRWLDVARPWWGLFHFFHGDPAQMQMFRDQGLAVWWADDHARIVFLRPLAGLTHLLDYRLFPSVPALMHLHSLGWYLALALVAALLYRRVLGARAAALAGLLYAVDHTHGGVIGWIANRNAMTAAAFALSAVLLYDRASRGHRIASFLGAAMLALGLLSGESAIGAAGYLAAHAIFLDRRALRERARDLAPHAAVILAWATVYKLGHYGAQGSGMYLDPGRHPLRVLAQVPEHATLLVAAEWGGIAPELELLLSPSGRVALLALSAVLVAASLAAIAPLLRARATTRFLLAGAVLSLLPTCATVPATRLLLLPGFGLLGVVAEAMVELFAGPPRLGLVRRVCRGYFAGWVGLGHLFLSPIFLVPMAWQIVLFQGQIDGFAKSFPRDDAALAAQRLVVVNMPDPAFAGYVAVTRDARGDTVPRAMLGLATGTRPSSIARVRDDAVEVTAPGGFYQWATDYLVRDPEVPLPVGTRFRLSDVTIEILHATPAGIPDVARFTFDGGVDAARFRWVRWEGGRYVPFAPPSVGAAVSIAPRAPGS